MNFQRVAAIATRTLVILARDKFADDVASELVNLLKTTTPEQLYEASTKKIALIDYQTEYWVNKKKTVVAIVKRDNKQRMAIAMLKDITLKMILEKVYLQIHDSKSARALQNLGFILNTPRVYRWLEYNLDLIKKELEREFSLSL